MKLELKHLAPYLPYELKVSKIHKLNIGCRIGSIGHILTTNSNKYKPILRPLSDLTKEIEHNGEKFIPYNKMCFNSKDIYATCLKNDNWASIDAIPHYDWGKLTEWHFDVFGLVEQGLAIDINTLQNER